MAVAVAESQFETRLRPGQVLYEVPSMSTVINVAEMPDDQECIQQAQANLLSRKAGDIALGGAVETIAKPIRNGKEGLEWAAEGDEDGIQMLDANIVKEMSEYLYKAGNISKVMLKTDVFGRMLQNGQLMRDVYRNGYQMASAHPVLKERSRAEGNNGARLEKFYSEGMLDDHTMFVFSRTTDGLSDEELDKLHFFSATKTISIQATTNSSEGLTTETAFVAGVSEDGAERNDKEVVEAIYEYFGMDCSGLTAEELIDMPLLIPNELIKNGVIDIVKLYDEINGGTFYGQSVGQKDYLDHKAFCEKREKNLEEDKQRIRMQLISENSILPDAVSVSKRLAKLVEENLVKKAINDESIDARVFGKESAENIFAARKQSRIGNYEMAAIHAQTAIKTATGGSCPSSLESLAKLMGAGQGAKEESNSEEDCEFISKSCPKCGEKNVLTKSTAHKIIGNCGCVAWK
jgi:ribosomal protein S27AE